MILDPDTIIFLLRTLRSDLPDVSPETATLALSQALTDVAVLVAILDAAARHARIIQPTPSPLTTPTHDHAAARLLLIRTDLRTLHRHTTHDATHTILPTALWEAFCTQADPENSPHYSESAP